MKDSSSSDPRVVAPHGPSSQNARTRLLPALSLSLALLCLAPHAARGQEALWKTYIESGTRAEERGDYPEAERRYKLALEKAERFGADDYRLALTLSKLITIRLNQGNRKDAEQFYERALRIWNKDAGPYPLETVDAIDKAAQGYMKNKEHAKAEPLLQMALKIRRDESKSGHIQIAYNVYLQASNYFYQGKYAEAEPLYDEALRIIEQHPQWGTEHRDYATVLTDAAQNQVKLKRDKEAGDLYERAIRALARARGAEHPEVATLTSEVFNFYKANGRYEEAGKLLKAALEVSEKAYKSDDDVVVRQQSRLVDFYKERKQYGDAEKSFKRIIDLRVSALGESHRLVGMGWHDLAEMYSEQEEFDKALDAYGRSLAATEKKEGEEAQGYAAHLHWHIGDTNKMKGRYGEAEESYKRSMALYALMPRRGSALADTRERLALLYQLRGRHAEAEEEFKKSLAFFEQAVEAADDEYERRKAESRLAETYEKYAALLREMGRAADASAAEASAKKLAPKADRR